jgi:hypothetical protein
MLPSMPPKRRPATPARKMQEYRRRLREQGLRPVQIWVPDPEVPGFRRSLRKQVARLDAAVEADALGFIAAVAEDPTR